MMVDNNLARLILNQLDKLSKPRMAIQVDKDNVFYVFMLTDIKNLDYKTLYKEVRKSLKNK